jgi:hypothetical protein
MHLSFLPYVPHAASISFLYYRRTGRAVPHLILSPYRQSSTPPYTIAVPAEQYTTLYYRRNRQSSTPPRNVHNCLSVDMT